VATAQPTRAEQRRRDAALAVGVTVGAAAAGSQAPVPEPAVRASAAGSILAALVGFLADQRTQTAEWLRGKLKGRLGKDEVEALIVEEQDREAAFAEGQALRIARDVGTALGIADPKVREQAVRIIMDREERFARWRSVAMAARSFAAVERRRLRRDSPQGAFWELDPTVQEHTPGCLFMGGRFWPWKVLDRVHPPRHGGCPCRLRGYRDAIAAGLMRAGDVPNVRDAVKAAAPIIMEMEHGVTPSAEEFELWGQLVERGMASPEDLYEAWRVREASAGE
jgi:hypothetical protein